MYTKINNGLYLLKEDFLDTHTLNLENVLTNSLLWNTYEIKIFGKKILSPRLTAWYGDEQCVMKYSGLTFYPIPFTKELLYIKSEIENLTQHKFNCVLANLYRDGNDSMGWHADDEKETGINPVMASYSLGTERVFQLKHNISKERIDIPLKNNSLLVMAGEMQHYWKHQIPKSKKVNQLRINLTFRYIEKNLYI